MIGTHAASVIADAVCKGVRDFDLELAYEAIFKDATCVPDHPSYGRQGLADYLRLGYIPCETVKEATARTLEVAYDDFCVARMAQELGKSPEAKMFLKRSQNYQNVYDPSVGFMRGRKNDGSWLENFDPVEWGGPFTEGSAWHYTFTAFHDNQGLIDLMGGRDGFIAKLQLASKSFGIS